MGAEIRDAEEIKDLILGGVYERDPETYWHCIRVGFYCKTLARLAGLDEKLQLQAEFAGIFHDIGKIAVPDEIINKPGPLNAKEFEWIKKHPEISAEMISKYASSDFFKDLLPAVKHHHERIDGKGYPDKLKGDEIPLLARLILIVDTFDAMTQDRPYRKGREADVAFDELERCSGTQFDSELVAAFLSEKELWRHELIITRDRMSSANDDFLLEQKAA